jgi:cell division protein FtsW (lipid II flippase)
MLINLAKINLIVLLAYVIGEQMNFNDIFLGIFIKCVLIIGASIALFFWALDWRLALEVLRSWRKI